MKAVAQILNFDIDDLIIAQLFLLLPLKHKFLYFPKHNDDDVIKSKTS